MAFKILANQTKTNQKLLAELLTITRLNLNIEGKQ